MVTDPGTGAQTIISRDGLLNAGTGFSNNDHQVERYAVYVADQIEAERFNFDIGFRYEQFNGDISRERTATFVTDATTPNLSTALRDVVWGNGTFLTGRVETNAWALAAGALYKLTDDLNIYANGSRGYFFPEIRSVSFNSLGETASFSPEIIKQAEIGVKYSRPGLSFSIAGLYTKLDNRRQVLFVNDGQGGLREQVNIVATRAWGLESTLSFDLADNLQFNGNLTLQDATYTAFDTAPANIGNELERQPNLLYNAGLYYDDGAFDAAIFTNYTGDNFTAANNAIELGGFNVVNLDAGYRIPVGSDRSIRVGINVFNLLDSEAVTEGSPRQDSNQTGGGSFFVGRPVLPRRITGRVTFNF